MQRRRTGSGIGYIIAPQACCVGAIDERDAGLPGRQPFQNPLEFGVGDAHIIFFAGKRL